MATCVKHFFSQEGWTPLTNAAYYGHTEVCQELLKAGAKIDQAREVRSFEAFT